MKELGGARGASNESRQAAINQAGGVVAPLDTLNLHLSNGAKAEPEKH